MLSCSVPFVQTNVQLLATCYLHNNQPYAAYHILKGNIICSRYYHPAVPGHYCVVMSLRFESKQLEYIVHFVGIFLILHFRLFFSFYVGVKVVWMIYGFCFYCTMKGRSCQSPGTCLLCHAFGWTSCVKQKIHYVQSMNQTLRYAAYLLNDLFMLLQINV